MKDWNELKCIRFNWIKSKSLHKMTYRQTKCNDYTKFEKLAVCIESKLPFWIELLFMIKLNLHLNELNQIKYFDFT